MSNSRTTVTQGNLRVVVFDKDEPIEGYKKKTWVPPAEWGEGEVMSESVIRPNFPRSSGNATFASGNGTSDRAGVFHTMAVPYERLYFEKVDKWVSRLIRPCHGYDITPPPAQQQPTFNEDDLCAVPV
jgi:hypothetical protein